MQSVSSLEHARALQCMLHNANKDCLSGLSQLDVENAGSCYVRIAAYRRSIYVIPNFFLVLGGLITLLVFCCRKLADHCNERD
jgi:hypothetical protein